MKEVLERIGPRLAPGSLVMDTCSVKALPVEWMEQTMPESVQILGNHPMFGPDSGLGGVKLTDSEIATPGCRKLLDIIEQTCNDSWQLFFDLQLYNPYTKDIRASLSS